MTHENDFDRIVQQKLNERQFTPSEESWNKAAALIESQEGGSASRFFSRSTILLLLLFFFAGAGTLIYFNLPGSKNDQPQANNIARSSNGTASNADNSAAPANSNNDVSSGGISSGNDAEHDQSADPNSSNSANTTSVNTHSGAFSSNVTTSAGNSNSSSGTMTANADHTASSSSTTSNNASASHNTADQHSSFTATSNIASSDINAHTTDHLTGNHDEFPHDALHSHDVNMNHADADPNVNANMNHADAADPNINKNLNHADATDPNVNNNLNLADAANPNINGNMNHSDAAQPNVDTTMHVLSASSYAIDTAMRRVVQKNLDADSAANSQQHSSSSSSSNGNMNFFFAELGVTLIPGKHISAFNPWGNASPGSSVNPVLGAGYEFHLVNNFSLQAGLRYTSVKNIADSTKTYYEVNYSFGSTGSLTEISMKRLHYFELPLNAYWHFAGRQSVSAGMTFNYLYATESTRITRMYDGGLERQSQTASIFGYGNTLNRFDAELNFGYGFNFSDHVSAHLQAFYGLTTLRNADMYGIDLFSRNKGFMFTLQYSF